MHESKRKGQNCAAPTWQEHTLEIKDDQDKRSQTCGEDHPANPAHPHQVEQHLFHGQRKEIHGDGGTDEHQCECEWRSADADAAVLVLLTRRETGLPD